MRAGSATVDITPPLGGYLQGHFNPRQSVGIHDPLTAVALVLADHEREIALVGCDLIAMDLGVCRIARALIEADCGIPGDAVMIWSTHTHAGPIMSGGARDPRDDEYMAVLARKLAGAVKMAQQRAQEARLQVALGREERISFNRRYRMRDGSTRTNPGVGNPDVIASAGPIDADVGCLYVSGEGGMASVLVNFACHLDVLGSGNHLISADYPYYMRETLKAAGLCGADVLFANGCCGNLNHINVFARERQGGFEHAEKMGRVLAGEVLKGLVSPEELQGPVGFRRLDLELAYRPLSEEELAGFRAVLEDDAIAATDFRKINARGKLAMVERGQATQMTEIQAFRVGDLAFVGIPAEYFVEFGLRVKQQSPAKWTFVVELANDCVGYVPTEDGFAQGAYEGQSARFAAQTGALLADEAGRLLQELWAQ